MFTASLILCNQASGSGAISESDKELIAVDFATKRSGFRDKTHWILQRNAVDFATKRSGFRDKTHWILRQNALDFATKRSGFCDKTHWILRQNKNFNTYKGAIYENIVGDMLVKQGYELFYYKNEKASVCKR